MHNRDLIWATKDGRKVKIKDMTSSHLTNTIKYIKKNIIKYNRMFGDNKVKEYLYSFKQEIRLRKLNRLNIKNDELF